jgi:hypothetical protein
VSQSQLADECVGRSGDAFQGKLAEQSGIVFNVHFQIIGQVQRAGFLEDGEELSGGEAMPEILGEPELQLDASLGLEHTTAIEDLFFDPGHLGDVRMGRHLFPIGQAKAELKIPVSREMSFERGESHAARGRAGCVAFTARFPIWSGSPSAWDGKQRGARQSLETPRNEG